MEKQRVATVEAVAKWVTVLVTLGGFLLGYNLGPSKSVHRCKAPFF